MDTKWMAVTIIRAFILRQSYCLQHVSWRFRFTFKQESFCTERDCEHLLFMAVQIGASNLEICVMAAILLWQRLAVSMILWSEDLFEWALSDTMFWMKPIECWTWDSCLKSNKLFKRCHAKVTTMHLASHDKH